MTIRKLRPAIAAAAVVLVVAAGTPAVAVAGPPRFRPVTPDLGAPVAGRSWSPGARPAAASSLSARLPQAHWPALADTSVALGSPGAFRSVGSSGIAVAAASPGVSKVRVSLLDRAPAARYGTGPALLV
jgi:hypothetical protein